MKTQSVHSQKSPISLSSTIAVTTVALLGLLSACDSREKVAKNEVRMEDRMEKRVDNAQDVTSDAWITTQVKTALLADSMTKGLEIEVTTVKGVVSLDGKVQNKDAAMHAQKIAGDIKGVNRVDTGGLKTE